jgi:hypothetical protein
MRRIIYAGAFALSALFVGCDKDHDGIVNRRDPIDNRTGAIDNPAALTKKDDIDTRGMIQTPAPPPYVPPEKIVVIEKDNNLGPVEELFLKSAKEDLADVKSALARGDDPGARCIKGKDYRETLKAKTSPEADAVMAELTKICDYEAPIKVMEREVSEAEKARREKPTDNPVTECLSLDFKRAEDNLSESHPNDQKFKELEARWNSACQPI